jgi:hypothetical protein
MVLPAANELHQITGNAVVAAQVRRNWERTPSAVGPFRKMVLSF